MFRDISSFFDKFLNIIPPDRFIKEVFIAVVSDIVGLTLQVRQVSVQGSILYVNADYTIKSEIILNKAKILQALSEKLRTHKKMPKDIR